MNRATENNVALEQRSREEHQQSQVGDEGSLDKQKLASSQPFFQSKNA